ncbi:MAG: Fe-S cluster assembly iron-binding protein IscA [Clostridium sp.]|jgi:Fe-S cluster assembly iron-binding protein IscA
MPALGLVLDKQKNDDFFITVEGISFVIERKVKIYFESTEILYNPEAFNKGFYVHRYRTSSI